MNDKKTAYGLSMLAALVLSYSAIGAPPTNTPQQMPIRLVADEWCPQHCKTSGPNKGYIVDIVEQALKEENVPFTLVYTPWLRALRGTEKGEYDGILTPTVNGFKQFSYPQEAVGQQQYCFYVNKDSNWKYTKPTDLIGKNISHLKESGFGELDSFLTAKHNKITIQEFVGVDGFTQSIFKFLAMNRTEAIIMTSDVYFYALKTQKINDQFKSAGCLAEEKLAVGLSKADPKRAQWIANTLDNGIRKLRKSGKLKLILANYGMN